MLTQRCVGIGFINQLTNGPAVGILADILLLNNLCFYEYTSDASELALGIILH